MPRLVFVRDFNWHPPAHGGRVTVRFRAGAEYRVTRECAAAARAAGAATAADRPKRKGKTDAGR